MPCRACTAAVSNLEHKGGKKTLKPSINALLLDKNGEGAMGSS